MFRLLLLILVIAGVAGYFTRPGEPALREAANAVLSDPQNISQGLEGLGATLAGERDYSNYFVVERYVVSLDNRTLVECWGGFQQVHCNRPDAAAS